MTAMHSQAGITVGQEDAAEEASPDLGARAADRLWSVGGDLHPADVLIHSWKLASSVNRLGQSYNPSSVMSIPVSRGM